MSTLKRRLAAAAAAACLTAGLGVATAGTAQATAASCGLTDVGNPGILTIDGTRPVGQVQQIYNTCNGTAQAHFVWDSQYRSALPFADATVALTASNGTVASVTQPASAGQTVDTPWVDINSQNPQTYQAFTQVICVQGYGSWHAYADGSNWGDRAFNSCI
ncbi:hypothetical protein ACFZB9_24455 [Kitasatospora sp. NPDC008050]|uniref:hypothetical protein n=1 Tax=Kitasatospora sp. NPDC008050 TaxID=3364021 RepID=UPI0036E12C5F